ncbi:MAG: cytidine deaminase [Acidimicrobiales bacterium]|jgi:cytidine deaminase
MAKLPDVVSAITDPRERELAQRAFEVSFKAYAPSSKFHVGAAVRTTRGTYLGCNVENGSYGLTSCAERNAVFAAVTAEGGKVQIEAVAVYARAPGKKVKTASPCGACRQVLAEFGRGAVVTFLEGGRFRSMTLEELLPAAFELF